MNYTECKALIETLGVHALLGPAGQGYGIEHNPHELATFLSAVEPLGIHTVLEIGTGYKAGTARLMAEALSWQVTTIDVVDYHHPFAGIEFLIAPNLDALEGRTFDLVIIDGDHAYESVKRDYEQYGSLGRVVMFHDIAGLRDCEGAARYWQDISRTKRGNLRSGFDEVIAEGEQAAGIGWVVRHA